MGRTLVTVGSSALAAAALLSGALPGFASPLPRPLASPESKNPAWALRQPGSSRSIGFPWRGKLISGLRLSESETVRHYDRHRVDDHYYGTTQLVRMLRRAASEVASQLPDARLSVGELSGANGGRIESHASHENGRDADLGFFIRLPDGTRREMQEFVEFGGDGRAVEATEPLRFDDRANWALVEALLRSPEAEVQYIFVASWLKQRLLRTARQRGADPAIVTRAERVLFQPRNALPHGNHFHVRIYCPRDDQPACLDRAPFWAWVSGPGVLPPAGPPTTPSDSDSGSGEHAE